MAIPNEELQGHRPESDGICGLATLALLCSRSVGVAGIFLVRSNSLADIIIAYFMVPLRGGVDFCFVLSGVLITRILLRTKAKGIISLHSTLAECFGYLLSTTSF